MFLVREACCCTPCFSFSRFFVVVSLFLPDLRIIHFHCAFARCTVIPCLRGQRTPPVSTARCHLRRLLSISNHCSGWQSGGCAPYALVCRPSAKIRCHLFPFCTYRLRPTSLFNEKTHREGKRHERILYANRPDKREISHQPGSISPCDPSIHFTCSFSSTIPRARPKYRKGE